MNGTMPETFSIAFNLGHVPQYESFPPLQASAGRGARTGLGAADFDISLMLLLFRCRPPSFGL